MFGSIGMVVVGLAILVVAADRVVVSAVRVSTRLGVSAILIGALIVGLGTSIPELLVSSIAAADGRLDVGAANVVGSNAANVTLVLGAAALVMPVAAAGKVIRRETPLMVISVAVLAVVLGDSSISRLEAYGLLIGLVVALVLLVIWSRGNPPQREEDDGDAAESSVAVELLYGILGIAATVIGARILLDGALDIGDRLAWSATFLGLLLGVGTSLPELATAIAAARHRESDLVLGNVIGSNIFNSLAVTGAAGVIGPGILADYDVAATWGMLGAVGLAAVVVVTGRRITRLEGLVLVVAFIGFATLTA